jgi:hypothetical protein
MDIMVFIASLNWPAGEIDRRIAALDREFGVEAAYSADMLLTEAEYQRYCQLPQPKRTVLTLEVLT